MIDGVFLLQGGEYEFRVKAVNAAGPSRPSATAGPLVIKDQTCEFPAAQKLSSSQRSATYLELHIFSPSVTNKS